MIPSKFVCSFYPPPTLFVGDEWQPMKFVTSFPTTHRVPSQGYIVWQRKILLKEVFRTLPGQEIGKLRKTLPKVRSVSRLTHLVPNMLSCV